jgi:hypothetical protein
VFLSFSGSPFILLRTIPQQYIPSFNKSSKSRKIVHILFNNMDPRELGNVTRREKDGRRKSGVPKWQILIQKTKEEWI